MGAGDLDFVWAVVKPLLGEVGRGGGSWLVQRGWPAFRAWLARVRAALRKPPGGGPSDPPPLPPSPARVRGELGRADQLISPQKFAAQNEPEGPRA